MSQLIIIAGYLSLLLVLAFFANRLARGTSKDYLLASHTIGPVLLLMSLFGTTMTAFALVGSTGEAFKEGIGVYGQLASSSGIVHSLCFFLVGVQLWKIGHRHGYSTQIQFFRDRLESDVLGMIMFPVLVGLVIPYLLIGVIAAGDLVNGVTEGAFSTAFAEYKHGVPPWLAKIVICGVVLTYVFFGGMRGTAWANAFQTTVFMVLGVVTFFVISQQLGGKSGLFENFRAASQAVLEAPDASAKLARSHMSHLKFASYMLIPLSVGMFPHIFQHWLTARSAASFKLPVVAHPLFIMIVWAPCVLIGVWATSDLAAIPETVRANGVLAYLVRNLAGDVLGGFLSAGILAAIMSSLDSQFLCLGSMFTNDIMLHYCGRDRFSDRQTVMMARIFIVAIVLLTLGLSMFEPRRVFTLGVWCFSGFSSLFPLVVAAIYWRRLTKAGAMAAVLTTCGTWLLFFTLSDFAKNPKFTVFGMMPVATMMAASTAAMILVSLVTRAPSEKTLTKFFPSN